MRTIDCVRKCCSASAGVRMLRTLGHTKIARFHMNEGHASLLTLELLDEQAHRAGRATFTHEDVARGQAAMRVHHPYPGAGRSRPVPSG